MKNLNLYLSSNILYTKVLSAILKSRVKNAAWFRHYVTMISSFRAQKRLINLYLP